MQVACIKAAFDNLGDLKIDAPPEVEKLKNAVKSIGEWAANLGDDSKAEPASGGGGMMGGMMNMAQNVASAVGEGGLKALCSGLAALTEKLDEPFQDVAQDVLKDNKAKLYNVCVTYINAFKFKDPVLISKGSIDGGIYKNVKPDTISNAMITVAGNALCDVMQPEVQEAIKEHLVTKSWKAAQDAYTKAYDMAIKVASADALEKVGVVPVKCELNRYITVKIWEALKAKMGEEEGAIRKMEDDVAKGQKDVTDKPRRKPETFALVFSERPRMVSNYNEWSK
jgi:hypothetical protein